MRMAVAAVAACWALLAGGAAAQPLIIVGWDGAGKINVDRLLAEGRLPALQAFIDDGAIYAPMSPNGSTETVAQWTAAFTGLGAAQSGVLAQFKMPVEISAHFNGAGIYTDMRWWLAEIPWEKFVFEAILAADPARQLGWFVSKGALQADAFGAVPVNATVAGFHPPGSPPGAECVAGDGYIHELEVDALSLISGGGDYLMFVHLNPDHFGHHCGENATEYEDEFIRADSVLETLRVAAPEARFLVLADHGFDEEGTHPFLHGHGNAPDLWLATDLPIHPKFAQGWPARAEMRDIAATLLDWYDLSWTDRIPQLRGKSLISSDGME